MNAHLESGSHTTPGWALWVDRLTTWTLYASAVLVLATAACFMRWAVMVDDDVVRAARPAQIGWWNYVVGFVYMHWQGRWASAGLESAVLPRVDLVHYYWTLIAAVAAVDLAGIYVVVRYGLRLSTAKSIGVTTVVAAFLWAGVPSPAETIYWFVGAVENSMNLAIAAVVIVAVSRSKPTVPVTCILAIAAMIVCGFHELYGAMFCLILAIGTAAAFFTGSSRRFVWAIVTAAATVGLIAVIAAPGNAERQHQEGSRHGMQVVYDAKITISQLRYYLRVWTIPMSRTSAREPGTGRWAGAMVVAAAFLLACSGGGNVLRLRFAKFPWKWVVPPVWITCVAIGFFGPSLAFGIWMPDRTVSGVWIVFVTGLFASIYLWTRHGFWRNDRFLRPARWAGRLALAASLLVTGNFVVARSDQKKKLTPWHDAVEQRYAMLQTGTGQDVSVPPLPAPPALLRTSELLEHGPAIYYKSWAFWFRQKSVRVDPPVPDKPGE